MEAVWGNLLRVRDSKEETSWETVGVVHGRLCGPLAHPQDRVKADFKSSQYVWRILKPFKVHNSTNVSFCIA